MKLTGWLILFSTLLTFGFGSSARADQLLVSASSMRTPASPLDGKNLQGEQFVFVEPSATPAQVIFHIDGVLIQTEKKSPYDLGGTAANGAAQAFDFDQLSVGAHQLTAQITGTDGAVSQLEASFTTGNASGVISAIPGLLHFAITDGGISSQSLELSHPDGLNEVVTIQTSANWLSVSSSSASLPQDILVTVNPQNLPLGDYSAFVVVTDSSAKQTQIPVSLSLFDTASFLNMGLTSSASDELMLVWATTQADASSAIQYRISGASQWQTSVGSALQQHNGNYFHQAKLVALTPATDYEYRVKLTGSAPDRGWSKIYQTRSLPDSASDALNAVFVADTGLIGRLDGLAQGTQSVIEQIASLSPDLVLLGGDYAYYNTDKRYGSLDSTIDAWFAQMQPIASAHPMMPTYGNHETLLGEDFSTWRARFPTPDGWDGGRMYSYDVGGIHFIAIYGIHENLALSQSALDWLTADLEAAQSAGVQWIIPYFHASPFTDGSNHPAALDLRDQLGPLFEHYGVRLAISAHDQAYERSYPLVDMPAQNAPASSRQQCYFDEPGVVWLKSSPGGKLSNISLGFSPFQSEQWPNWTAQRNNTLHNFAQLQTDGAGNLTVSAWGIDPSLTELIAIDRFRLSASPCLPELIAPKQIDVQQHVSAGNSGNLTIAMEAEGNTTPVVTIASDASWLVPVQSSMTLPAQANVDLDFTGLNAGKYLANITLSSPGYQSRTVAVVVTLDDAQYQLNVSTNANRTNAIDLNGAQLSDVGYVFISPETNIAQVEFFVDDVTLSGAPYSTEKSAPYDLAGGQVSSANGFDFSLLAPGVHNISARINRTDGSQSLVSANFTVPSGLSLQTSVSQWQATLVAPQNSLQKTVSVSVSDGSIQAVSASSDKTWLNVTPTSTLTPANLTLTIDASALAFGSHSAAVTVNAADASSVVIPVGLNYLATAGFELSESSVSVSATTGGPTIEQILDLSYTDSDVHSFTAITNQPWVSVAPASGSTPAQLQLTFDPAGLSAGNYQAELTLSGDDTLVLPLQMQVSDPVASSFTLMQSNNADRSGAQPLAGKQLGGNLFIYTQPEAGVSQVDFYLDRPIDGNPDKTEKVAPFDFAGTGSGLSALPYNSLLLADGLHTLYARVTLADGSSEDIQAQFSTNNFESLPAFLSTPASVSETLSNADTAVNQTLLLGLNAAADGSAPDYSISSDSSWVSASPASGTAPASISVSLNPTGLGAGVYQGQLTVSSSSLPDYAIPVTLTVEDAQLKLIANPTSINLVLAPDSGVHSSPLTLAASDDAQVLFNEQLSHTWMSLDTVTGVTPEDLTLHIDTTGLTEGNYSASVLLTSPGYASVLIPVNLAITTEDPCSPVVCSEIRKALPYALEFDQPLPGLADKDGEATGISYVLPSSNAEAYLPDNLDLDTDAGVLRMTTTSGILHLDNNNQANVLGIGFAGPNQITKISTQLNNPSPGTGKYEQAGLWFGYDEDNYVKLTYNSFPGKPVVEFSHEAAGAVVESKQASAGDLSGVNIVFELLANPATRVVTASYSIAGGPLTVLAEFTVDPEFFSFDAAGLDPVIGTRSFAGIAATHRKGSSPISYEFEYLHIEEGTPNTGASEFEFTKSSHPLSFGTSMAWAPDGKLYVSELFGTIHALTYDDNLQVINDEVISSLVDSLGARLTLGITVRQDDPADPTHYSLWVSSSSPSVDDGVPNSGTISRLSGPGFSNVEQVITGLPRAKANHATNNLRFGPDDRLYITVGGNTGAGAPVDVATEFGDMAEQPLSAALIVADVFAPGFDGSCHNETDIFGPPPCDVHTYATGMRNAYDFVFHSNGEIYSADNGLGVTGAFPSQPAPDCSGVADASSVAEGGNNPGEQPDLLYHVLPGAYYGHPNPSRDECVFKDGSLQGVAPLANYQPPMGSLGYHASANGMDEYKSNRACGKLTGNLLVVRYSLGDDVLAVALSDDGTQISKQSSIITGLNDPLTLTEHKGNIFVSEFGAGVISAFKLISPPCWTDAAPLPMDLLDPASAANSSTLFVTAGKQVGGHVNTHFAYNLADDSWTQLPDKPGPAVENAAAMATEDSLYFFAGSTAPFTGATSQAWRYDIDSQNWQALAPVPVAVGGVRAERIGDKIYLVGGMDNSGASSALLQVYDVTSNSWSQAAAMPQPRDNPGTAVVDGKLYVLGGRHRNSDGSVVVEGHTSVVIYDPASNSWSSGPAMPNARRTLTTAVIDGGLYVLGGESGGIVPPSIDRLDLATGNWSSVGSAPLPRHGAAYGVFGNRLVVTAGGVVAGSSFSADTQIMTVQPE